MKELIKKLSYSALVIRTIRFLGLKPLLRKWYYFILGPKAGFLAITVAGIPGKYHVADADELRLVESVTGQWGEGKVLSALLALVRPNDTLLDVGANVGTYTVLFSKAAPQGRVLAFEPEDAAYARLTENLALNATHNVTAFKTALGAENQAGFLQVGAIAGNSALTEGSGQKVQIARGDDFFTEKALPIPRLIKIDVEGYEYAVLEGLKVILSNPSCQVICCEIHPDFLPKEITDETILTYLRSLGFSKIQLFKKLFFKPYHVIAEKNA